MATVSSQVRGHLSESGSLLEALDAITNWRAFVTLVATFTALAVAAAVLGGMSVYYATKSASLGELMGLAFGLLCVIIAVLQSEFSNFASLDSTETRFPLGKKETHLWS